MEACHNDAVGGCHFGRDKTAAKVSARYYWKSINNDVADWVCQLHCRIYFVAIKLTKYCASVIIGKTLRGMSTHQKEI